MSAAIKGRGAKSNATGRYEAGVREAFDDGWTADDADIQPLRTTLSPEHARTLISRNTSPDIGFDRSINPYKGCEHGCIYCYARPSHAWMGLSPGLDFESRIFFKPDAACLLEQELSKPRYVCRRIHIGGNTDPYQPVERTLNSTRSILEVMQRFNHPFSIITKSVLIGRDADILGPMGKAGLASAFVSLTTLDRKLARAMEPRASTPAKRLEAIRRLADAGSKAADLQVLSQQLANQGRDAVGGNAQAFTAFKATRNAIEQNVSTLQGRYGKEPGVAGAIATLGETWAPLGKQAGQLVASEPAVLALAGNANNFTGAVPGLQACAGEVDILSVQPITQLSP